MRRDLQFGTAMIAVNIWGTLVLANTPSRAQGAPPAGVSGSRRGNGEPSWEKLRGRLAEMNHDIQTKGILPFPGTNEKLLTSYAYKEFYDWDLYSENIYLSYYGLSRYCFSNFKVFLSRQQPDGFVSRRLRSPRTKQIFKPLLGQKTLGRYDRNCKNLVIFSLS